MDWLLDYSEEYRSQPRQGPFFKTLSRAERPNDLQWVHQLVHQSREFTQAPRSALCHDNRYQPVPSGRLVLRWRQNSVSAQVIVRRGDFAWLTIADGRVRHGSPPSLSLLRKRGEGGRVPSAQRRRLTARR